VSERFAEAKLGIDNSNPNAKNNIFIFIRISPFLFSIFGN
jgi:hypothetical protein